MDHDRTPANLLDCKMTGENILSRVATIIDYQHRQVAAMTDGAERSKMLFSVSRIVVAAGGKARGRLSLIHAGPAVVLVVNMEPMLSGRQPGELWRDHQAIGV